MAEITAQVDIEAKCNDCGKTLTMWTHEDRYGITDYIEIEPCESCVDDAETKGYDAGHKEGFAEGESDD